MELHKPIIVVFNKMDLCVSHANANNSTNNSNIIHEILINLFYKQLLTHMETTNNRSNLEVIASINNNVIKMLLKPTASKVHFMSNTYTPADCNTFVTIQFEFISCKMGGNIVSLEDALHQAITRLQSDSSTYNSSSSSPASPVALDSSTFASDSRVHVDQEILQNILQHSTDDVLITRERHYHHLVQCYNHIDAILQSQSSSSKGEYAMSLDIIAEEMRLCLKHIGIILGKVDVEEVLDIIFRDFCIGK